MSIFEYDEEKHTRSEGEEGIRQGIELKLFLLVCKKLAKGNTAAEIAETLKNRKM